MMSMPVGGASRTLEPAADAKKSKNISQITKIQNEKLNADKKSNLIFNKKYDIIYM